MGDKTLKEKAQDRINDEREQKQILQIQERLEGIAMYKKYIDNFEKEIVEIENGKVLR